MLITEGNFKIAAYSEVIWPISSTLCDKMAELKLTRMVSGFSKYKRVDNLRKGNRVAMAKLMVRTT